MTKHHRTDGKLIVENELLRRRIAELEATEIELRLTAEALQRSEETARVLLNTTMDAAILISTEGALLSLNEIAAQRFGRPGSDLVGCNLFDLLPPHEVPAKRTRILEVMRSGRPLRFVDESEGHFADYSIRPVFGADGRLEKLAVFFRDITPQVKAEIGLRKAKELAERADIAKSKFLAKMSHELRTPLNAIIGFSEILEDQTFGPLNEKQLGYVGHVLSSGRHLLKLINEILDLAKIESGKEELEISSINAIAVLKTSLDMMKEMAMRKNVTLDLQVAPFADRAAVMADEVKFREIVVNLLSNAVKFSFDGGRVLLCAERTESDLLVSVCDSGIGVNPDDQERIFDPFEQVDPKSAGKILGTGLGLALSKRMVELHGGSIWVESEGEGKGSSFRFTIPLRDTQLPTTKNIW